MTKVLEFTVGTNVNYPVTYEVHLLNVGQTFAGFGGSSASHLVTKTASMIIRKKSAAGHEDTEYDIDHPGIWLWLSRLLDESKCKDITTADVKKPLIAPGKATPRRRRRAVVQR